MITGTRLCRLLPKGRKNRPGDQLKNDQWNRLDQGDGSNDHLIDTRPAFLSAMSWHIIRHWLSPTKVTILFHFTKAFAEK